jgi:hypothetical protein
MPTLRRSALSIALILLTVASITLAVVGASVLPLVATAVLGWFAVIARRWGPGLGIASSVLGAGVLLLAQMILSAIVGVPIAVGSLVVWTILALAAALLLAKGDTAGRHARVAGFARAWLPPLLGPASWAIVMILTVVLPSASRFSWVMMGDSANNILFARETTYSDGIRLGGDENPVPLPAALIALAMSAGRAATPLSELLRHDIAAFALVWGMIVALACYLAGVSASICVESSRRWLVAVVGAGASLIPLSWFVTGYPIEYGFFNAHVALVVVFASWIAAKSSAGNPALALSALLAGCTLMLAVWSPLVLVPLALVLGVFLRNRRELLALRGRQLVLPIVAVVQLAIFGIVGTLPSLVAQGGFLSGVGGIVPFPRTIIIVAAVGSLAVAGFALWRKRADVAIALASVVAAGVVGIGVLLFLSRAQPSPWTYYPTKLAWLMTIVFAVVALGTLVGVLPLMRPFLLSLVVLCLGVGTLGALYYAARSVPSFVGHDPIPRILADDFGANDDVAERIFSLSDPESPHLLWKSADPAEGSINFWLLQMRADPTKEHRDLRVFAYGHGDSVDDLCDIVTAMGGRVTVITADSSLPAAVAAACPAAATVQLTG